MAKSPAPPSSKPSFKLTKCIITFSWHFIWLWLTLIISLWFSWQLLSKIDFGYPFWYQYGGIKNHIETYAPQNRYKLHFETTDDAQRQNLFHQIAQAVQLPPPQAQKQLKNLYYTPANGQKIPLLTAPEIQHLIDVSQLIQKLNAIGQSLALIWIGLTLWRLLKKHPFPNGKTTLWTFLIGLGSLLAILALLGPTQVFYQLHHWLFPPEHPWFFYYQESLMTTLMAAPLLFGQITLLLLITSLGLLGLIWKIFHRLTCIPPQNCG